MKKNQKTKVLSILLLMLLLFNLGCGSSGGGEKEKKYVLRYDGNGNTGGTIPADDIIYNEGEFVTVIANVGELEKEGYIFIEWNTKKDGTGIKYEAGDKIEVLRDITLYAKWEKVIELEKYQVVFNSNGGSLVEKLSDIVEGDKIPDPGIPTKEGYQFLGWYKEVELNIIWDFEIDKVTENITLYAKWEKSSSDEIDWYAIYDLKKIPNGYKILKYKDLEEKDVVIPEIIYGKSVLVIGENAFL